MDTKELEERIRRLEAQLAFLRGAAVVVAACVVAFLGYTIIDIPRQVRARVAEKIGADTVERAERFNQEYSKLSASEESVRQKIFGGSYEVVPVYQLEAKHPSGAFSHLFTVAPDADNLKGWTRQGISFYALNKR